MGFLSRALAQEVIMEHQDQKAVEILVSQTAEHTGERQDESRETKSYRAPQVYLIGKASHLVAAHTTGDRHDYGNWYIYQ